MPEQSNSSDSNPSQVTNLTDVDAGSVRAELVRIQRSSAQEIEAEEVELLQSAAFDVRTVNLTATSSALGLVRGADIQMHKSAAGAVRGQNVSVNGAVGAVVAGSVDLGNTYAGLVAGREVRGDRIESLILFSPRVHGNVSTVLDTRGVVIAGLISGLFGGLIFLLGRSVFGRK